MTTRAECSAWSKLRSGVSIHASSAGAVLTMLADTMMPEAFDDAGPAVGLATVLGYAIGALLTLV